jgi:hypothetical protein
MLSSGSRFIANRGCGEAMSSFNVLRPSSLTHVKKLAAIIVVLGFAFWLWFGASTYHSPRATYPYYDTQKPVPPWSEPMPLEGNYDRGEEHK